MAFQDLPRGGEPLEELDERTVSRVSFAFRYSGPAIDAGLMDVRDLAPALLALGDLCEQANYQVNTGGVAVKVQIRAFAPGSFFVDFWLNVGVLLTLANTFGINPINTAKDVFDLVKSAIETAKFIKGRVDATQLENGHTRLTIDHKHTFDVADRVYDLISKRAVQDDIKQIVSPLRHEGIEELNILENGEVVEVVEADDVQFIDNLHRALPTAEPEVVETTSTIEKSFKVISLSSDPRHRWRLTDGTNTITVKVDDHHLHEAAQEGHLGIEPGFIVKVRIRSETTFVDGEPKTENHLLKILEVKPPEPRDDGTNRLL